MILQFQTGCTPPFTYKEYSVWDNIEIYLTLLSIAILYAGCTYYLLYALKLITNKLKKSFNNENN